jgi:hypothetical protein
MTKILVFLILVVFGNIVFAEEFPDDLNRKIWKGIKRTSENDYDLSWITEEIRPAVIERFIRWSKDDDSVTRRAGDKFLVILGHPETIQRFVNELRTNPYKGRELGDLTEEGIPYIIPLVYHGSPQKPPLDGDVVVDSIRTNAVGCLVGAIARSKKFPQETKLWATQLAGKIRDVSGDEELKEHMKLVTDPKQREHGEARILEIVGNRNRSEKCYELLIQWWENNQTAIIEKRYADATWLPRYKGKPTTYSPEEMAERKADREGESSTRESRRSGVENTITNATPTPNKNWSLWGIIICFAALLGISIRWKIAGRRNS